MNIFKRAIVGISIFLSISLLSYKPAISKFEATERGFVEAISMCLPESIGNNMLKRNEEKKVNNMGLDDLVAISNAQAFETDANSLNINTEDFLKEFINKSLNASEKTCEFYIGNKKYNLNGADNIDLETSKSIEKSLTENSGSTTRSANVSFTGIQVSRDTCAEIYQWSINLGEKINNHYSGAIGTFVNVVCAAAKLGVSVFITTFVAKVTSILSAITMFLNTSPYGIIIKAILMIFAAIALIILGHIIWAGANGKGFKMGLKWTGWFKAEWVYEFTR
jgi:hypothetical protein